QHARDAPAEPATRRIRARGPPPLPGRSGSAAARRLGAGARRGLRPRRHPTRPMRRFVYLGLVVALLPWIVIGVVRAGDGDTGSHYYVRAIFDNASTLVAGEDVKIAGA